MMEKALHESEELFRQMAEVANDALVVMDSAGRATYWNPAAERIFGYSSDEVLGGEIAPLLSHPDDRAYHEEIVRDFGSTGTGPMLGASSEVPAVNKDGDIVPVEVSSSAFMTSGEWKAVINMRDITERVQAREAIKKHADELKDMVSVAAHELRHPATVLKGYAAVLLEYGHDLDDDTVSDALVSMDRGADRLAYLIDKLFVASRIEQGDLSLNLEEVDPGELMADAVRQTEKKGTWNVLHIEPGLKKWTVMLDREKVMSVLMIILDNAIKHTPRGTEIDLACARRDRETVFSVADHDPGMPEEAFTKVFEPFYQVEDAGHHSKPGMGLGLHIAKSYVEAHGGWITAEPRNGGGTVFRFGIPDRSGA